MGALKYVYLKLKWIVVLERRCDVECCVAEEELSSNLKEKK